MLKLLNLFIYFYLWRLDLPWRVFAITRFGHTTLGRTPLDQWSARRRDRCLTTHNTHKRQTSMSPAGSELAIPASERPQTRALDRAATGTGSRRSTKCISLQLQLEMQTDLDWRSLSSCSGVCPCVSGGCLYRQVLMHNRGPGNVVGIATGYGLDGLGIELRWGARFSVPVQTGPGANPASCTVGTGSFLGVKCGRPWRWPPHPF